MHAQEILYHMESWLRGQEERVCRAAGVVDFEYAPADRWMSCEEAAAQAYAAIEPGARWGAEWQYGWFRGMAVAPPEAAGRRLVLLPDFGGESTVYVNGRLAGAKDHQHPSILLAGEAAAGQRFEVMAEAYAGHGKEELPLYGRTRIAVVNEQCYQFGIDLKALLQLRRGLDPASLRVSEIDRGFRRLLAELDWSEHGPGPEETARQGRLILAPLLACVNGSTAPKLFLMGQSHLDLAWLWPLEETKRKVARTLSNQLALLEQYPEYRYVQSQPFLLRMAKELYPELYGRAKRYAAEGRLIAEGGVWVEPDTNIPGGESLIRQFLHGKRFIKDEFGTDSELLWLPDVFGYSGNLPQIMRKCGIRYFASVKMYQTYDNVSDPFPYNTFVWEGIDGSEVAAHLLDYGPYPNPADVSYALLQWNGRVQKEGISTRLAQFGHGDGGGGATRDDLEFLRRLDDLEGAPRTVIASPIDYFEDQLERGMPDARYVGELYYPAHRGTLTSQAKMKRGNRRAEFALREAELWSARAALEGRLPYPRKALDEGWSRLLFLQFHDILPGTSIKRVHEEAAREFDEVLAAADGLIRAAASALTDGDAARGVTYFNSLSWNRAALVELPEGWAGAVDAGGVLVPVQLREGKTWARVTLPPMGNLSLARADGGKSASAAEASPVKATTTSLENELLKLTLNEYGEIVGLFDNETGEEWLGGIGNRFLMYRDTPSNFDAWEIDRRYEDSPVELAEPAEIEVVAEGPLLAAIRVRRRLHRSELVQEIRLEAGSRRIEFHTTVDWREKHKLLKVGFATSLRAREVMSEIQFGHIVRPTHASRPHDADRYEVAQQKWSALAEGDRCFSLLNDGKYGLSADGSGLQLTLLRAPSSPDETADEGVHDFTYALHVWNGGFTSNPVVREAFELNVPVPAVPGSALSGGGEADGWFTVDRPQVIIDAVKLAEDGSNDAILRLYESKGASVSCTVASRPAIVGAAETDMLEADVVRELRPASPHALELAFTPFEVKTVRLKLGHMAGEAVEG